MLSDGVRPPDASGLPAPKSAEPVRRESAAKAGSSDQAPSEGRTADRASISRDAAEVARYRTLAELHREAFGPHEPTAKLEEVKRRIAEGHYDRPEMADRLAGKLVDESASLPVGSRDVTHLRHRTESGFYERPEVVDQTAEQMVKAVLPKPED